MNWLKLVAGLVVAAALLLFASQNTQAVTLHFLMFKVPSTPMVVALFVAALLGGLLGLIVSAPGRLRRLRERRGLQVQVAAHEREVTVLADATEARTV